MRQILSVLILSLSLTAAASANDGANKRTDGSAPGAAISALSTNANDAITNAKGTNQKGEKGKHEHKKHKKGKHAHKKHKKHKKHGKK